MEGSGHHHPSKRLKTTSPDWSTKGKETVEEATTDTGSDSTVEMTCGICLSDDGRSIRGWIDSCNHFFCFICIMEWAKVESRCPMCKQRFRSIRRPRVRGIFSCDRVVDVPVRDQVYHLLGNESRGPSDPYVDVNCSECNSTANDHLLLLCDLCDSATHTYCVGLGSTVPEGDWFCLDCTISRDEHSKSQMDADCFSQDSIPKIVLDEITSDSSRRSSNIRVLEQQSNEDRPPARSATSQRESQNSVSPVSISEIVSDEFASYSSRRSSNIPVIDQQRKDRPPSTNATSQSEPQDSVLHSEQSSPTVPVRETASSARVKVAEQGARTLHRCRKLQDRIRALRENWNALRAGSIDFSLGLNNGTTCDSKTTSDISRQAKPSSINSETITAEACASSKPHSKRTSRDVDRAWKMMEKAKSIQGARKCTLSDHPIISCEKRDVSKGARNLNRNSFVRKDKTPVQKVPSSTGSNKEYRHFSLEIVDKECESQTFEKQKPNGATMKEIRQTDKGPPNPFVSTYGEMSSVKEDGSPFQEDGHGKVGLAPQQLLHERSIIHDRQDAPTCSGSGACSLSEACSRSFSRMYPIVSPHHMLELHNANLSVDKSADEIRIRGNGIANNIAKSEFQSLVKTNMKLLNTDQPLGKGGLAPQQLLHEAPVLRDRWNPPASSDSAASLSGTSSLSLSRTKPLESSHCTIRSCNLDLGASTDVNEKAVSRNDIADNNAKDEVQSLVKLNLKLLSRDQRLGANKFKEVARVATHTILATCGLEHSKSNARIFPSPICRHTEQIKHRPRSNLMPSSCRECFYNFIKDVVNSVVSEKKTSLPSSC